MSEQDFGLCMQPHQFVEVARSEGTRFELQELSIYRASIKRTKESKIQSLENFVE